MNNITILVVDDESRMRKLIKDFLAQKGYSILEAGDGEEGRHRYYRAVWRRFLLCLYDCGKSDGDFQKIRHG